jgi:hypothetical protein
MKRISFSLKYMLMTYRLDMLWLPAAFWALFVIMGWIMRDDWQGFGFSVAYFGIALPLIGGIMASYAVLEDPALELQFAAPRPAWMMLLERLGMILVIAMLCAVSYQITLAALGIDLSPLGGLAARQLSWLVPTLAMIALGSSVSFASRQAVAGSAVTGMVWIIQIIIRDGLLSSRWAQYLLLFMGSNYPDYPTLRENQAVLMALALLMVVAAWALLRKQERYI